MRETVQSTTTNLELLTIRPQPIRIGRRRVIAAGGVALLCLLAQEPGISLASPLIKPKPPIDEQPFHTIIQDRFGLTEITHGKNTQTGSLSLTPAEDLLDQLNALNLFSSGDIYTPIFEQHTFDQHFFGYEMAGLVNPRTPTQPYQIAIEIVNFPHTFGLAKTPWLSGDQLKSIQELGLSWENGEIVEATALYK